MIKKRSMLFAAVLCFALCFAFAGCNKAPVQLQNGQGALLEGGGFEKGSTLVTDLIETTGEKGQEIVALLDEQTYAKDGEVSIYDIFVAKDGSEVQPNGKVKITLPASFESENGYVTFHVKDDDSVETLETTYSEGKISFETESFSYFVVAEDEKYYDFSLINVDGRGTVCFEDLELPTKGEALSTGRHAGKELPLAVKDIEDGYAFIGWFGSTDLSNVWDIKYDNLLSTETTFNFTMPANGYVIYAVFRPVREFNTLGVINVGGRGTVGVDGEETSDESDLSFSRTEGSESVLVAKDTLEGYAFVGWYGTMDTSNVWALKYEVLLSTEKTFTFTMPPYDYIIYAVFKPTHTVYAFADKDTEGTIKWGENNQSTAPEVKVAEGKSVALTAVPNEGYKFLGWYDEPKNENEQIGSLICADATYTVNVDDSDVNLYARFEKIPEPVPEEYPLTVGQQGAGGSVSVNGDTPGSLESSPYYENYEAGESITLVARTRSAEYTFLGWFEPDEGQATHLVLKDTPVCTELTYAFEMPEKGYTVYAVFGEAEQETKYLFSAFVARGTGAIYYNGDEQPNGYQSEIAAGGTVTLTAVAGENYAFVGWFEPDEAEVTTLVLKDTPVSTEATHTFTVTDDYSVYAVFEEAVTYSLSAYIDGEGGYFEVDGEDGGKDFYQYGLVGGDTVTLKVVANDGYKFKGWYAATDVPEFISASSEYTFTVGNEDISVEAVFEANVTALILDGANAGFTEGVAAYTIGDETKPNPEYVVVYGVTADGNVYLTKDEDYTIDLGGLDFTKAGTYTVTYTYIQNVSVKETLQIVVSAPKYLFSAVVGTSGGLISRNDETLPNGYSGEHEEGDTVTLKAVANEGYKFKGWYTDTDVPQLISASAEYTFTIGNEDAYVTAGFEAVVTGLILDGANAGFTEGVASYTIGGETQPNPEYVVVYGVTAEGNVLLTKDEDYTVDLGGLNFEAAGTYTITYTYLGNASVTETLEAVVYDAESVSLSYDGSAYESEYNGGCGAYVYKSSILNNGAPCDVEALGLSYEWRDMSGNEVAVAYDTTWDAEACFDAPSQAGTYNFVIYGYVNGVKTDFLTLERTVTTRTVSLISELSVSEYEYYVPIARVAGENNSVKYYAMTMPGELGSTTATKIPAVEVVPDENGNFVIGNNNEFIFRPYDLGKREQESDGTSTVLYNLRVGGGPYRTGALYMSSSGSLSYDSGYSAGDFAVKMYLNADGSVTVHCTHEGGVLRFAYSETEGYYFTAYNPPETVEDTGTYYPVYLYNTYVAPPTENYQYIGGDLNKTYDGAAVTVNPYKDFVILTADGEDWAALSKYGTGRFAWGTGKGENLQAMTEDGEGNLAGPSEVGEYCIVFQMQDKEGNWQTMGYGPLVYFSITEAV